MSLYIRLFNSFWSHRKLARLKTRIGESAMWVPIRLWCYAAENQPDGNFSDYIPEEVAMLIGYQGDAPSMLQALCDCGFMDQDTMTIHDWHEHNNYHEKFAEKARAAALARWSSKKSQSPSTPPSRKEKKRKEKSKHCSSNAQACSKHAELIYAEYPKKCGKKAAIKAIEKALRDVEFMYLMDRTRAFANAWKLWSDEKKQFTKHPATWFNSGCYEDDPETWVEKPKTQKNAPISLLEKMLEEI